MAAIGASVYSHQTMYAQLQQSSGWPTIAAAKAVERITEPSDVMLGCGFDWSPEIPYYAGRRALMFPNSATDEAMAQEFRALEKYKIGAAVVCFEPSLWEGDYAKRFRAALTENLRRHGLSRFPSCSIGPLSAFPAARYERACRALFDGKQRRGKGQMAEAIAALDEAIAGLPREPEPYLQRGLCRVSSGQNDAGLQDCETAMRLSPVELFLYFPCAGILHGSPKQGRHSQQSRVRGWSAACRS